MPPIFKIVLFLMALFIIIYLLVNLQNKYSPMYRDFCRNDFDCPSNEHCLYDRDYDNSICVSNGTIDCGLTAGKDLKECDPSAANFCANSCVNQPPFLCRIVTPGRLQVTSPGDKNLYSPNPNDVVKSLPVAYKLQQSTSIGQGSGMTVDATISGGIVVSAVISNIGNNKYSKNDALVIAVPKPASGVKSASPINLANISIVELANPFVWKQGSTVINVPNSNPGKGWCLPDVRQKTCNQFTSTSVLTEINDGGKTAYTWDCHCNNNLMFDKDENGDCLVEKACGYDSSAPGINLIKSLFTNADGNAVSCTSDSHCTTAQSCLDNNGNPANKTKCTDNCFCYENWLLNKNTNPMDGFCVCDQASASDNQYSANTEPSTYQKLCLADTCKVPGCSSCGCNNEQGDTCNGCGCDLAVGMQNTWNTYIPCDSTTRKAYYSPDSGNNPDYWYGHVLGCQVDGVGDPKCIQNPCNSDMCYAQLHADSSKFDCIVKDPASTIGPVFANNPVGSTCIDLCNDGKSLKNGVIFDCGDRGTCKVVTDAKGVRTQQCECNENYANGPGDVYCQTKLSGLKGPCMCGVTNNGCVPGMTCNGPCNFGTSGSVCCTNYDPNNFPYCF